MHLVKFLFLFMQIFNFYMVLSNSTPVTQHNRLGFDCTKSYDDIMRNLRENWQSPIFYLKKRGYIPKETSKNQAQSIAHNQPSQNTRNKQQPVQPVETDNNKMIKTIKKYIQLRGNKLSQKAPKPLKQQQTNDLKSNNANLTLSKKSNTQTIAIKSQAPTPVRISLHGSNTPTISVQGNDRTSIGISPAPKQLSPSKSSLSRAELMARLEAAHNASFLSNVKEKLFGLFRNRPNDIEKEKLKLENVDKKAATNKEELKHEKNLPIINSNYFGKSFKDSNKIDRELQLILESQIENHKRRHSMRRKSKKRRPYHSKHKKAHVHHDNYELCQ